MDSEEMTLEKKCECVMNVVVESRKRFGKMCEEYEKKAVIMENRMLKLEVDIIHNCKFKPKVVPQINMDDMMKEIDDFKNDILENKKRIENLKKKLNNVKLVVSQLKEDKIGQKLRKLSFENTAEEMPSNEKA